MQENLKSFLRELAELTKKYDLEIGGCGCDGSPWVEVVGGDTVLTGLTYNSETQTYFEDAPDYPEVTYNPKTLEELEQEAGIG